MAECAYHGRHADNHNLLVGTATSQTPAVYVAPETVLVWHIRYIWRLGLCQDILVRVAANLHGFQMANTLNIDGECSYTTLHGWVTTVFLPTVYIPNTKPSLQLKNGQLQDGLVLCGTLLELCVSP